MSKKMFKYPLLLFCLISILVGLLSFTVPRLMAHYATDYAVEMEHHYQFFQETLNEKIVAIKKWAEEYLSEPQFAALQSEYGKAEQQLHAFKTEAQQLFKSFHTDVSAKPDHKELQAFHDKIKPLWSGYNQVVLGLNNYERSFFVKMISIKEKEIEQLRKKVEQLKKTVHSKNLAIDSLQNTIASLQSNLEILEREILDISEVNGNTVSELEALISKLHQDIAGLKGNQEQGQQQLNDSKAQIKVLKEELANTTAINKTYLLDVSKNSFHATYMLKEKKRKERKVQLDKRKFHSRNYVKRIDFEFLSPVPFAVDSKPILVEVELLDQDRVLVSPEYSLSVPIIDGIGSGQIKLRKKLNRGSYFLAVSHKGKICYYYEFKIS